MILQCPAEGPSPLKGDMLVIAGASLYAVSNVTEVSTKSHLSAQVYVMGEKYIEGFVSTTFQEYIVKKSSRIEVMAMLGVFGAIISGIQMYPFGLSQSRTVLSSVVLQLNLSDKRSKLYFVGSQDTSNYIY